MTKTKTVPIEPTDEMIDAGVLSDNTLEAMGEDYPSYQQSCINIYKAMLEAAPPVEDVETNTSQDVNINDIQPDNNDHTVQPHEMVEPDNAEALEACFEEITRILDGGGKYCPDKAYDALEAIRHAITNQSIQGCDEVVVRKSDLTKAAAVLMLPNNGVCDTIWYADATTLYEHLVGLAEIDDLSGIVEEDYQRLSGEPYPQPPEQKGE